MDKKAKDKQAEKKEETNAERRAREEKEEAKKEKNDEEVWKKEKEEIDKRIVKNSKSAQNQIKNISQIDKDVYYLVNK